MAMSDVLLCCGQCGKPVLLLTDDQVERVDAAPERYSFACTACIGETDPPPYDH